jgi:hypothetical protein
MKAATRCGSSVTGPIVRVRGPGQSTPDSGRPLANARGSVSGLLLTRTATVRERTAPRLPSCHAETYVSFPTCRLPEADSGVQHPVVLYHLRGRPKYQHKRQPIAQFGFVPPTFRHSAAGRRIGFVLKRRTYCAFRPLRQKLGSFGIFPIRPGRAGLGGPLLHVIREIDIWNPTCRARTQAFDVRALNGKTSWNLPQTSH